MNWVETLMGGVSRQTYAATLPPDRFYCILSELPLHLVPRPLRSFVDEPHGGRDLYLNPECKIFRAPDLPEVIASRGDLVSAFAFQGTIAWVPDAGNPLPLPFWLGPDLEKLVTDLRRDEPAPASFPEEARSLLERAGILVCLENAMKRQAERDEKLAKAGMLFRKKGYAPIRGLIHPFHVAALRRYYRYQIRTGAIHLGDGQSARRYVAHNDSVARFFHQQIARSLSIVAGEPVKPSYVYLASYLSGAELKKHTDREQCEFSVTLCLDFSPEPAVATPWPIHLDTPSGAVTVYQMLGDGLAYRGTRLPHYREKLGEGQTSTSIFLHYVGADYAGPLD